ncbi:hypothetical protein ANCCEY_02734 [Ancylostoma ceylanicum]|uniref:GP-PDE domain-containing protein n=1 Tax=Ancylostoma ceylanicum TaxID=53326 RepID=A0A0D6MC05_9BILA|nr:hypothetical protein ANCCEY_02734 [Ancylostoma ceylanicum]
MDTVTDHISDFFTSHLTGPLLAWNDIDRGLNRSSYFHGFSVGGNIADTKDAPENSMAALELALKSSKYVLFDVQLASDGAAVVIKDATTGRTTEKNMTVAQSSSVDLAKLNLKTGEGTVPLFKDMMDKCREKEAKVVLQVQENSQALLAEISDYVRKNFVKEAKSRKMMVVALDADSKPAQNWLHDVAKIPYFTRNLKNMDGAKHTEAAKEE